MSNEVFVPWIICYRYTRISSRDRTNIIFLILIFDNRIPDHLLMDKVFANIFTGYSKLSDIHIQMSILCIEKSFSRHWSFCPYLKCSKLRLVVSLIVYFQDPIRRAIHIKQAGWHIFGKSVKRVGWLKRAGRNIFWKFLSKNA